MEESGTEDGSAGPAATAAAATSVGDSIVVIAPADPIPSIEVGPTVSAAWGSHLADACKNGDVLRAANAICGGADVGVGTHPLPGLSLPCFMLMFSAFTNLRCCTYASALHGGGGRLIALLQTREECGFVHSLSLNDAS